METILYPPSPQNVPESSTRPSPAFKREVTRTTIHIILFILLYIVLLCAGLALALALGVAGFFIITEVPKPVFILLGLGLAGIGFMVLYFLVKFVFATSRQSDEGKIEITEEQHPRLFAFIGQVSQETGTQFPAHIYLTPGVSAYVSYDSNFLSLFMPVKKNLTIGLGLVNMVDLGEFKAVVAHEFGHFSQNSMRAGSYVYHANKVIYNILFDNDSYSHILARWASIHSIFAICARVTASIVHAIQYLLQQAYKIINKAYLGLSRQMEFHADAVAAKLSGSNNLVHALRRVDFADSCYNQVIERYNDFLKDRHQGNNVFAHQMITASYIARSQKLQMVQGLPVLHGQVKQFVTYNRVQVDDRWSSHPSREHREKALEALAIDGVVSVESPWLLFNEPEKMQQEMTKLLYRNVDLGGNVRMVDNSIFARKLDEVYEKFTYPELYKGYYDNRYITPWVLGNSYSDAEIMDIPAFFEEHNNLLARINAAQQDVELLKHIEDKKNGYAEFNYDGEKAKRAAAQGIRSQLEAFVNTSQQQMQVNDRRAYNWFLQHAEKVGQATAIKAVYSDYFAISRMVPEQLQFCQDLYALIIPFFENTYTADATTHMVGKLIAHTRMFVDHIHKMAEKTACLSTPDVYMLPDKIQDLPGKKLLYTVNGQLVEDDVNYISAAVQLYYKWNQDIQFTAYKTLLRVQVELCAG